MTGGVPQCVPAAPLPTPNPSPSSTQGSTRPFRTSSACSHSAHLWFLRSSSLYEVDYKKGLPVRRSPTTTEPLTNEDKCPNMHRTLGKASHCLIFFSQLPLSQSHRFCSKPRMGRRKSEPGFSITVQCHPGILRVPDWTLPGPCYHLQNTNPPSAWGQDVAATVRSSGSHFAKYSLGMQAMA